MRGQAHTAELDTISIGNNAVWGNRLVRELVAPVEISFPSAHYKLAVEFARDHGRIRAAFHLCEAPTVVKMCVAVQQELQVSRSKSKFLDVGCHLRQHLNGACIQQNVSCRGHNQE